LCIAVKHLCTAASLCSLYHTTPGKQMEPNKSGTKIICKDCCGVPHTAPGDAV
jgi:hypothetical protein